MLFFWRYTQPHPGFYAKWNGWTYMISWTRVAPAFQPSHVCEEWGTGLRNEQLMLLLQILHVHHSSGSCFCGVLSINNKSQGNLPLSLLNYYCYKYMRVESDLLFSNMKNWRKWFLFYSKVRFNVCQHPHPGILYGQDAEPSEKN